MVFGVVPVWLIAAVVVAILAYSIIKGIFSLYHKVPPNTAMVVFGGRRTPPVIGGGRVIIPGLQSTKELSLELVTFEVPEPNVPTLKGVKVNVNAVAQVKVGSEGIMLNTAVEQFLDSGIDGIKAASQHVLAAHLWSIVAGMTVEDLLRKRESFQTEVTNQSEAEMKKMGIQIISFNVREITDDNGYIENLGRAAIAEMKRDASIAEAEATQESRIRVANANQAATESEMKAEIAIGDATKDKDVQIAEFQEKSQAAKAKSENAYALQDAEIKNELAIKNGAVKVTEQQQAALAEAESVNVSRQRAQADTVIPAQAAQEKAKADAEALKIEAGAQAEKTKLEAGANAERVKLEAGAEAEKTRKTGEAAADATKAKLLAEAEGQRELAAALSANEGANLRKLSLELAAEVMKVQAAEYGSALGQFGSKISVTQIGSGNGSGGKLMGILQEFPELLAILNANSNALAGKNLGELAQTLFGLLAGVKAGDEEQAIEAPKVASNGHSEGETAEVAAEVLGAEKAPVALASLSEEGVANLSS